MQVLKRSSTSEFPFQDFIEKGFELKKIENKINFKLKKLIKKTHHSFRVTLIERLEMINCPEEIISEILGIKSKNIFYNNQISIEMKLSWLNQII